MLLATILVGVIAYVFTDFKRSVTRALVEHNILIAKLTEAVESLELSFARYDERLQSVERKLKLKK